MEEDFWDKYVEKRRLKIEAEEEEREKLRESKEREI